MKKLFNGIILSVVLLLLATACGSGDVEEQTVDTTAGFTSTEASVTETTTEAVKSETTEKVDDKPKYASEMLEEERNSIVVGKLSP